MGLISIENMEFFAYHGCFSEEQIIGTRFIVDLYIEADTTEAEQTDKLSLTINYQEVFLMVKDQMAIKSHLLEHLARRILNALQKNFQGIDYAEVKVSKMNPPLGGKVGNVSLTLSTEDE